VWVGAIAPAPLIKNLGELSGNPPVRAIAAPLVRYPSARIFQLGETFVIVRLA
jgi:hypothetical protein